MSSRTRNNTCNDESRVSRTSRCSRCPPHAPLNVALDGNSIFYPPVSDTSHTFQHGSSNSISSSIGFGEHSDPQILIVLRSNGMAGLQISLRNVVFDPFAFCVNVGDVLQAMTNGRFVSVSVRHRAMSNRSINESRLSMVFFGAPPPEEAIITCPPELLKENEPLYKVTWAVYKSHIYAHLLAVTTLDHFKIA